MSRSASRVPHFASRIPPGSCGATWQAQANHGRLPQRLCMATIYGMAVQKTTVYLDAADYRRLKAIARSRGRTPAELVREAVAKYAAEEQPRRRPRSLGAGRSRTGNIGERAEELLAGMGKRR